jgi:hypothetical protein
VYALHFRNDQVALAEEGPNLQFVGARSSTKDTTGQVDGGERELGKEWSGDIDLPPLGLDFDDAANDQITDLGCVSGAEGMDGKELIGFVDCTGDSGDN